MQQRKKQPAVTRQSILDAAGASFTSYGYSATSLVPIVSAAGLTKGALFHHFPDKRALALAWIAGDLTAAIRELWVDPLDDIGSLNSFISFCRVRCADLHSGDATSALVSLAAETAAADPLLAAALEDTFALWRAAFCALLDRGKSAGWIHHSIKPAVEAAVLVALISGLAVTLKCHPDDALRRLTVAGLEGYLETLRPQ